MKAAAALLAAQADVDQRRFDLTVGFSGRFRHGRLSKDYEGHSRHFTVILGSLKTAGFSSKTLIT